MTLQEFCNIEKDVKIPLIYSSKTEYTDVSGEYEEEIEVILPYMAYVVEGKTTTKADNTVIYKRPQVRLELYTEHKDVKMEAKIEEWLEEHDIEYEEEHPGEIPAEGCRVHLVIYSFVL